MERSEPADLEALLAALVEAGIEFLVVGGAAAVLHGAPTTTWDLDIVHRRSPQNIHLLSALLEKLHATVRDPAGRNLRPTRAHLEGSGQLQLVTDYGPFDVLGTLHDGRGWDELQGNSMTMGDQTLRVHVLDLPTLIEIKSSLGRAKDRLVLPVLLALLEQHKKR
jgi:hypothetical protein